MDKDEILARVKKVKDDMARRAGLSEEELQKKELMLEAEFNKRGSVLSIPEMAVLFGGSPDPANIALGSQLLGFFCPRLREMVEELEKDELASEVTGGMTINMLVLAVTLTFRQLGMPIEDIVMSASRAALLVESFEQETGMGPEGENRPSGA